MFLYRSPQDWFIDVNVIYDIRGLAASKLASLSAAKTKSAKQAASESTHESFGVGDVVKVQLITNLNSEAAEGLVSDLSL